MGIFWSCCSYILCWFTFCSCVLPMSEICLSFSVDRFAARHMCEHLSLCSEGLRRPIDYQLYDLLNSCSGTAKIDRKVDFQAYDMFNFCSGSRKIAKFVSASTIGNDCRSSFAILGIYLVYHCRNCTIRRRKNQLCGLFWVYRCRKRANRKVDCKYEKK